MDSYSKHCRSMLFSSIMIIIVITGSSFLPCHGQEDTVKNFKNTIRMNLSNPLIFAYKFNVFGYERVIKDYQSASINIGRTGFPKFSSSPDSLGLDNNQDDKGFNLSLDYRFYLQKENRHKAPRGIYIGPYYSFNWFSRDLSWDLKTTNYTGKVETGFDVYANFVGVQLGYQFIFWERLAVDMVLMGPGWWHFNVKSNFDTDLTADDEEMLLGQINDMLDEKFPGNEFLIGGNGLDVSKNSSSNVAGFRYMINIGFRF